LNLAARLQSQIKSYPPLLRVLGAGNFINAVGLSFLWPLTSVYIHDVLGKPLTVAGIVLLLQSAGGILGALAGGVLFDRFGGRPVIVLGLVSASAVIALPGLYASWPLYVTAMFLYGLTMSLVFPAVNALAAKAWPEGGRRSFNFLYVLNNLGVAVGTAVGGLLAQYSFRLVFLSASAVTLVYAGFAVFFIHDRALKAGYRSTGGAEGTTDARTPTPAERSIPWVPVVALWAGFVVLWLVYVQFQGPVAVYMNSIGYGLSSYSVLWTLNGLVIVLGQPLMGYVVRFFKSIPSQMWLGTSLLIGGFLLLLLSHRYVAFVGTMLLLTFGEMLLWPGVPAAMAQLSPPSRRGFLQGFAASGAQGGRMLGPLLGGLLYDNAGYTTLLVVMTAGLAIPMLCFLVYARTSQGHINLAAKSEESQAS